MALQPYNSFGIAARAARMVRVRGEAREAAERLIDRARKRANGDGDNISLAIVKLLEAPKPKASGAADAKAGAADGRPGAPGMTASPYRSL